MTSKNRPRPPRIRLFQSDSLERLTVISPTAFAVTWAAIMALATWAGWGTASTAESFGLVSLGFAIWTAFEYCMHRFVFHLEFQSAWGRRAIFLMHGNHHAAPNDAYRNLMPLIVSVAILGSFWCLFLLVAGRPGSLLFLGFAIGYVTYDVVHYACHQFQMRGPLLRRLQRHHILHHHAKRDGNYAITAIFWDRVFGTRLATKER